MDRAKAQRKIIHFTPGPSKVYDNVPRYIEEAFKKNIPSFYHRSKGFQELYRATVELFREKLHVPEEYEIYFVNSATEVFEITASEYGKQFGSTHLFNGSFGEKWHRLAKNKYPNAFAYEYGLSTSYTHLEFLFSKALENSRFLALTHVETSNGFEFPLSLLRYATDDHLIAIDATSSMGGMNLPWEWADIWFASVQKCFGLPPGLAVLIVSPKALEYAPKENSSHHSIRNLHENYLKFQTANTPATLLIYLLYKILRHEIPSIEVVEKRIFERFQSWENWGKRYRKNFLTGDEKLRAKTVLTWEFQNKKLLHILRSYLRLNGFEIADGHGVWKGKAIRIANFPQFSDEEIDRLRQVLSYFFTIYSEKLIPEEEHEKW